VDRIERSPHSYGGTRDKNHVDGWRGWRSYQDLKWEEYTWEFTAKEKTTVIELHNRDAHHLERFRRAARGCHAFVDFNKSGGRDDFFS
jgi:hypothetical protein